MKRASLAIFIFLSFLFPLIANAQHTEIEKEVKQQKPIFETKDFRFFLFPNYEYSSIKQGSRKGNWRILTGHIALMHKNLESPYFEFTQNERFGEKDYTYAVGSYFKLKDDYLHAEASFGADVDYIYKNKVLLEHDHLLVKNLFLETRAIYLNYPADDVYIFSPGLFYYFGDNYVNISYNMSFKESYGLAQWGVIKGLFAINNKLRVWIGTAIGERLYDIYPRKASEQYGYIGFATFEYKINKDFGFNLGYSYSMEKPKFIKRSVNTGLFIKF
ncbi:MAG: YaiO family outer membrane beta-barrel protein [Candidatus Omnitrophota bacterium]